MKRSVKGKQYFYLEHTIRKNGRRVQRSQYLGRTIPKDIDKVRKEFEYQLNKEVWFNDYERIRRSFQAEQRTIPKSAIAKEQRQFSIKFTYNTQRIEGSTLSLKETLELIEHKVSPSGKPIEDAKEAEAHDELFQELIKLKKDISQDLVLESNWKLLKDTKPDVAGKLRRRGVGISGSKFVPPAPVEIQALLNDFFKWYNNAKRSTKMNPVELAGLVHLKFVTIHPFADGNGRVSRLLMNFVLNRHGFPMLNIEYSRRISYYSALERSQVNNEERPFMNWFFRRYKHECMHYLGRVQSEN